MRFDEAFEALVEYCANVAPSLRSASGHQGRSARMAAYGNDIWIANIARSYWTGRFATRNGPIRRTLCALL
jgi:hypothetical protein